ncbi:hypothetical protein ACLB2K_026516 [Fragaria x ananassa]
MQVLLSNATSVPLELQFDIPCVVSPKDLGAINPGQELLRLYTWLNPVGLDGVQLEMHLSGVNFEFEMAEVLKSQQSICGSEESGSRNRNCKKDMEIEIRGRYLIKQERELERLKLENDRIRRNWKYT